MAESRPLVLITGGGTGGHVFPGLAAATEIVARGARVHWLGTRSGMESRLVPAAGIALDFLDIAGVRGKGRSAQLKAPWRVLRAVVQALRILWRLRPSCVLGTGGFVAGPGGVAAWLLRVPIVLHEQNAVAGTTNRLLARLARRILLGLPGPFADNPRAELVGNPVRREIVALAADSAQRAQHTGALRVLVIGGSRGAQALNETLPAAVALLDPSDRPEVWHQCGERDASACTERYHAHGVDARVCAFIDDMAAAYAWADLVVCRAGALTVAELAVAGMPALLVPLPGAIDDHQSANACWLANHGAAIVIPQPEFTPQRLAQELTHLSVARAELQEMARRARLVAMPDAAVRVARVCLEVAR